MIFKYLKTTPTISWINKLEADICQTIDMLVSNKRNINFFLEG